MNAILDLIGKVAVATASQLFWLLGLIFVFGLLLYLVARFTRITYVKSVGIRMDIILTGWIGTPIHELGHTLFCLIFRHKIDEMKLWTPNSDDGTLGYVKHSYAPNSRYQKIGNFFIGIGPILFGTIVLYALLYFLMPSLRGLFSLSIQGIDGVSEVTAGSFKAMWVGFFPMLANVCRGIFSSDNLSIWQFWVFLYLSFCVASHIELSPPDIKGALSGLVTLIITFLIINLIVIGIETLGLHTYLGKFWQYVKLESYSSYINGFLVILGSLLTYALIISVLNFLLTYITMTVFSLIRSRGFINPFWI